MIGTILADAWRIAFLTASAPAIGAMLLLAIARATGARWDAVAPFAQGLPVAVLAAALLGVAQVAAVVPEHLSVWMHPLFVSARAIVAAGLATLAAVALGRGASVTLAAVILAVYAALVTPVASDWMLGQVPGHPVSAVGMMLFVEEIAGATALLLATGWGEAQVRQDMAKLMVAAALGLAYLGYMDYLIVWFGNLPSHVDFYVVRSTPDQGLLVCLALALGIGAPIALLTRMPGERGRRSAGICAGVALFLFNQWWVGGGFAAFVFALAATALLGGAGLLLLRRRGQTVTVHG